MRAMSISSGFIAHQERLNKISKDGYLIGYYVGLIPTRWLRLMLRGGSIPLFSQGEEQLYMTLWRNR